ncbi:TPA: hypothetical protein DEP94_02385 [Candidatus Nomurabacteria bacterium]|nr:hypothetical protein [Candidatus Nomurabacteria bacterium]
MFRKVKLQDIAEVYTGYTFREAVLPALNGNISVLQAKDIIQNESILNTSGLTKVSLELSRSNSYVLYNDILLISRARGPGSFRSTIFESKEKNVIASSSIFIIRITDKIILPKYISIYLNSSDGQNDLVQLLSGSYIKTVPRKNLEELQIPIPSLQKQKIFIELNENIKQQEKILERKKEIKQNIINTAFTNLVREQKI